VFSSRFLFRRPALYSAAIISCLSLAACGALPQPFSHDGNPNNPLLAPGERAGINVITVAGTPHGAALARQVAQALRDEDFAAQAQPKLSTGYTLVGRATIGPTESNTKARVRLLWLVLNLRGRPGGIHRQELVVDRTAWDRAATPLLKRLARDAVAGLAPLISDARAGPVAKAKPITVFDIDGAPGTDASACGGRLPSSSGNWGSASPNPLSGAPHPSCYWAPSKPCRPIKKTPNALK
jgi:hypothetical protein